MEQPLPLPLAPGVLPTAVAERANTFCCEAARGPVGSMPMGPAKLAKLAKLNNNASLAYPLRHWA
jgi:hypothetical protein